MSPRDPSSLAALTGERSRRSALQTGSALLAGLSALGQPLSTVAHGTPTIGVPGGGSLMVQSFSQGSLFPTQGDADSPSYTVYLWDAADRGFVYADCADGAAGVVASEAVLTALGAENPGRAVLVATAAEGSGSTAPTQGIWVLSLSYGGLGSDPGAVTYQGEPLADEDVASWLETAPAAPSEGPQELGQGFLILSGFSGFDVGEGARLKLT